MTNQVETIIITILMVQVLCCSTVDIWWLAEMKMKSVYETELQRYMSHYVRLCWSSQSETLRNKDGSCGRESIKANLGDYLARREDIELYSALLSNLTSCVKNEDHCSDPCADRPCDNPATHSLGGMCERVWPSVVHRGAIQGQSWDMAWSVGDFKCHCRNGDERWDALRHECVSFSRCDWWRPCVEANTVYCIDHNSSSPSQLSFYTCHCLPQFQGTQCESEVNFCARNESICGDHGTCVMLDDVSNETNYSHSCVCDQGWARSSENSAPNCDQSSSEMKAAKPKIGNIVLIAIPVSIVTVCCICVGVGKTCSARRDKDSNKERNKPAGQPQFAPKRLLLSQPSGTHTLHESTSLLGDHQHTEQPSPNFQSLPLGTSAKKTYGKLGARGATKTMKIDLDESSSILNSTFDIETNTSYLSLGKKKRKVGKLTERNLSKNYRSKKRIERVLSSSSSSSSETVEDLVVSPESRKCFMPKLDCEASKSDSGSFDKDCASSSDKNRHLMGGDVMKRLKSSWIHAKDTYKHTKSKKHKFEVISLEN